MTDRKRLERGTYIGGHEVSAIAGMNPYMTSADVFVAIARGEREDIGDSPPVRRGTIIEPGFISWLEKEWGLKLERDVFVQDDDVPYMAGTIDALETKEDGSKVVHEFTSTTEVVNRWKENPLWTDEHPALYKWIQTQYYMGLSGAVSGWIHLFIADSGEIRHYPIERKDDAIDAYREEVEAFWIDHIMPGIPPTIDASDSGADDMVKRLYPISDGHVFEADTELIDLAYTYADIREKATHVDNQKKGIAAALKQRIGDADKATFDGGYVSWKNMKGRVSTDWQGLARSVMSDWPDDARAQEIQAFTKEGAGGRTLRVHIKKERE